MTATVETAPVTGAKTQWKLDPMHTLVEFSAKHLMITTVKGRIVDVEGIINIDERDPAATSVHEGGTPKHMVRGIGFSSL